MSHLQEELKLVNKPLKVDPREDELLHGTIFRQSGDSNKQQANRYFWAEKVII